MERLRGHGYADPMPPVRSQAPAEPSPEERREHARTVAENLDRTAMWIATAIANATRAAAEGDPVAWRSATASYDRAVEQFASYAKMAPKHQAYADPETAPKLESATARLAEVRALGASIQGEPQTAMPLPSCAEALLQALPPIEIDGPRGAVFERAFEATRNVICSEMTFSDIAKFKALVTTEPPTHPIGQRFARFNGDRQKALLGILASSKFRAHARALEDARVAAARAAAAGGIPAPTTIDSAPLRVEDAGAVDFDEPPKMDESRGTLTAKDTGAAPAGAAAPAASPEVERTRGTRDGEAAKARANGSAMDPAPRYDDIQSTIDMSEQGRAEREARAARHDDDGDGDDAIDATRGRRYAEGAKARADGSAMDAAPRYDDTRATIDTSEQGGAKRALRVARQASEDVAESGPFIEPTAAPSGCDLGDERTPLERSFGVSLGRVRVHSDETASRSAASVGALAFAIGDRIALPGALGGEQRRFILAHEVAHTVQQGGGTGGTGDPELAADAAAQAVLTGDPAPPQPAAPRSLAAYRGSTPTPGGVTTTTAQRGQPARGNAPRPIEAPSIPERYPAGPANDKVQDARPVKDEEHFIERTRAELERVELSKSVQGSAPTFTTMLPEKEHRIQSPFSLKTLHVRYEPHYFDFVRAILHDLDLIESIEEAEALWRAYLFNVVPEPTVPWARDDRDDGEPRPTPSRVDVPDGAAAKRLLIPGLFNDGPTADDLDGNLRTALLIAGVNEQARRKDRIRRALPRDHAEPSAEADPKSGAASAETDQRRERPIPTLRLPAAKAPHYFRYLKALGEGKLWHLKSYHRGSTDHEKIWKHSMLALIYVRMPHVLVGRGMQLTGGKIERLVIPDWSRRAEGVKMSVDHVVELQVTRPQDRDEMDSLDNLELLDRSTNFSSGSTIKAAIQRERENLADRTGDRGWLERDLKFEAVTVEGGGGQGERWSQEEIWSGEQVKALARIRGGG